MGEALHSRVASVRAFTDHVTHELKSPLTSIQGAAELLQNKEISLEDRALLCQTVSTASQRMNVLLNDLRRHTLASQSAGVGSCHLREALPEATQIEITTSGEALVPLPMADLNAILVQLIQNAVAHNAHKIELSWDGRVMRVVDDGDGVDHGNRDRIFDPFFTSRRETGGTGMGLAVVRSLLSAHGGRIELTESPSGAAFDIRLPS